MRCWQPTSVILQHAREADYDAAPNTRADMQSEGRMSDFAIELLATGLTGGGNCAR